MRTRRTGSEQLPYEGFLLLQWDILEASSQSILNRTSCLQLLQTILVRDNKYESSMGYPGGQQYGISRRSTVWDIPEVSNQSILNRTSCLQLLQTILVRDSKYETRTNQVSSKVFHAYLQFFLET